MTGDPTVRYGALSYWQDTEPERRPSVRVDAGRWFDLAVLGGGFTGLWTAYHVLERYPGTKVVLLEQEEVGYGSSGRGGGLLTGRVGPGWHRIIVTHGIEKAREAEAALTSAAASLVSTLEKERIDCDLRASEMTKVATTEAQEADLCRETDASERLGSETVRRLDSAAAAELGSPHLRMAVAVSGGGVVNPLKLSRRLAAVLRGKGVTIYERSGQVEAHDEESRVRVETPCGPVFAENCVVVTNAWMSRHRELSRLAAGIYSYYLASEPTGDLVTGTPDADAFFALEESGDLPRFARRTTDGRIVLGGSEMIPTFRTSIGTARDRNEVAFRKIAQWFKSEFPQFGKIRFTHAWGGPVAVTPDLLPRFGTLTPRVAYGLGSWGNSIALSFLAGQILADLSSGAVLTPTIFCEKPSRRFLPKPFGSLSMQLRMSTSK
jgi:glycine/D-amino acid oxidase-like deaminating enzyme